MWQLILVCFGSSGLDILFFWLMHLTLGNIHVLRKQKGGREGVSQMLTIAYVGGGGLGGHAYVIIFGFIFAIDETKNPKKSFKNDNKIPKKSLKL